ncbi:LysR substrate-binding domain-containing protein [Cupriavidus basilensis]|uniref:LysR substrate-binding domain-containing protein n=1 Tax=Cupriavidus basilensis TaxID=68895 RepID=UPI0020A68006|nr:LysR substrate-binding domain-containing protein [Cupriavidus basilensis]MCP3019824.1 LysR substrate-binding domain-containing protein [Cupriavidus basilensis]MDR3380622.1 LysR substrate-binding domain-containing protein [Cupriavidus basilensis]
MRSTNGRHLPALSHLVALEATVRLASVTGAADELCLTQSAVSKQLTELEEYLGVPMLTRRKGAVSPTQAGEQYLRAVRKVIAELEEATLEVLTSRGSGGRLDLRVPVSLGNIWLLPRLAGFAKAHPQIQVNVTAKAGTVDLRASGLDGAIQVCTGPPEGHVGVKVMPLALFPVCVPELLAQAESAQAALEHLPLLHQAEALEAWAGYFDVIGMAARRALRGPRYASLAMGLQAALSGMGIALLPDYVVREHLRAGRLVRLLDATYVSPKSYYFVCLEDKWHSPLVGVFLAWLLAEVAADAPPCISPEMPPQTPPQVPAGHE